MNLSLDKLKVFYFVVKEKSFKNASIVLNMQRSSISHVISYLENELGYVLMSRNKGGISLTVEGSRLYALIEKMFQTYETLEEFVTQSESIKGELTVVTWSGLATEILSNYVMAFKKEHPELKINLLSNNSFSRDFESYNADVCILPYFEDRPDLIQTKTYATNFYAFASKDYIEKFGMPSDFDELDQHQLLAAGIKHVGAFKYIDWHLSKGREKNDVRQPYMVINSTPGLAKYCLNGFGIANLPPYYGNLFEDDLVRLFPTYDPPEIDYYYIYPHYAEHMEKITKFRDFLKKPVPNMKNIF